jgi:hypothetical protein
VHPKKTKPSLTPKKYLKSLAKQNFHIFSGIILLCREVGTELDAAIQLSA